MKTQPERLETLNGARAFAAAAVLALAACATTPPPPLGTYDKVTQELAGAAASQQKRDDPEVARKALLPPLGSEPAPAAARPIEPRFDLAVSNAPAAQVFMAIVSNTRYSMLVHPEVTGTITVNLKDVTVREVLDTLRELYGYEYVLQGPRIMIQPITLQTRVFQVNYLASRRRGQTDLRVSSSSITSNSAGQPGTTGGIAPSPNVAGTTGSSTTAPVEASRVATTSDSDFWPEITAALRTLVGTEGGRHVVVSPHSGVIVVRAFPRELRNVENFLKATQLIVERQVMLEAKIIEVELKDEYQSGINWASFRSSGTHSGSLGADTNNFSLPRGIPFSQGATPLGGTDPALATLGGTLGSGLAGAAGRTAAGIFGIALQTSSFNALLQFLETQGSTQVLSSPRIATLNNQKAVLKVGTDEFFITNVSTSTSSTGNTSITSPTITTQPFFSGIALDVTPQIDDSVNIILHVHPSVSVVAEKSKAVNLGVLGNFTLPLASSSVNESDSIVRVRDGNIVAIGGLMRQQQSNGKTGVPVIGDVPVAGEFFSQKARNFLKRELVILIKPTVIEGDRGWQQDLIDTQGRMRDLNPGLLAPPPPQ
jgi:MSHA biogenesis protein MshL